MALVPISPPAVEPVSLIELKEFLRMDLGDTSQDTSLAEAELDARAFCEAFTGRRFVQQSWSLYLDFFPGYIDLKLAGAKVSSPFVSGSNAVLVGIRYALVPPYPPVRSIDRFQYQDANGDVTVMTETTPLNPNGDYVADLLSSPARLTPPFGKMWPVARVVVNAVQIDYTVGYASPLICSVSADSPGTVTASGYTFQASDVGRPIWIPGAGPNQTDLNTFIQAITSPPGATATLRCAGATEVSDVMGLLVNYGNPAHWYKIKRAIKVHTLNSYYQRMPRKEIEDSVQKILYPVRDLRN